MAFGLGRLRLAPNDFWRMTLRELSAAAEGVNGVRAPPMARGALEQLMKRFPDEAPWR
jgi:uncharacterized phage protein (TIGR02216 family)